MGKDRKQGAEIFAKKLQELMSKNNLTRKELAEKIGVARQTIGLYLAGACLPETDILAKLAKEYGVSIDYLVLGIESKAELLPEYIDVHGIPLRDDIIRYITRPKEDGYITLDDYGMANITEIKAGDFSESLEMVADAVALRQIEKDLAELKKRYREMMRRELEDYVSKMQKEG